MTPHPLDQKFREIARDGQQLADELERGQAATPLADHFGDLMRQFDTAPFCVAVVALDPKDRAELIVWLLGEEYRNISVRAGEIAGLMEIHSAERGFALELGDARRLEFDTVEPFLEALSSTPALAATNDPAMVSSLRLSLARPSGLQGLTLLVADKLSTVIESPGLTNALVTRSQLLLVAADSRSTIDAAAIDACAGLADGIGAWLPVSVNADDAAGRWATRVQTSSTTLSLLPVQLDRQPPPACLTGAGDELRRLLFLISWSRRLQQAAAAYIERYEQEVRQTQLRRSREDQALRVDPPGFENPGKRAFESLKLRAHEDLGALAKIGVESSRRSLLSDGVLTRALHEQLASLTTDDLHRELAPKSIKLTLDDAFQTHLQRALRKSLKEELLKDLATMRDGLDALRGELEVGLTKTQGQPVTLSLPPPAETEIWSRMGELINVEIRYRGEMPRRGFMQRLGEGRRMVFAVMMILSLVGSLAGFSWRGLYVVGIIFLLLFIGSVVFTYRSWKHEDEDKFATELERVREQLGMECKRIAAEVQREKQQRLGEHLDASKRALTLRVDELARDQMQRELEEANQQRERAKARARKIEQVQRELQSLQMRVGKLRQDSGALEMDAARQLREAARKQKLV